LSIETTQTAKIAVRPQGELLGRGYGEQVPQFEAASTIESNAGENHAGKWLAIRLDGCSKQEDDGTL
jgi:hypothetical protein